MANFMDNSENYLDQVIELLREGTDLKLLRESTLHAERALREANNIAEKHDLPKPWPQLVCYRLAHVLFRHAKSEEDFFEIDELLKRTAKSNSLGPLPRIYRLAAMFRCGFKPEQMKGVFNALLKQIDHYADDEDEEPPRFDRLTALQNNFFNMAELAAYFTGYPYDGFEGRGGLKEKTSDGNQKNSLKELGTQHGPIKNRDPFSDLYSRKRGWRLVGTLPGLASIAYPGEMALEEMEDRMEKGELKPPCVAFRISADKATHEWNFNLSKDGSEFIWKNALTNSNHLLFLTAIFHLSYVRTRAELLSIMFHDDTSKDDKKFRKWKERCDNAIVEGLRGNTNTNTIFDYSNVFLDDTASGRPVPAFRPEISVLGAFDADISFS